MPMPNMVHTLDLEIDRSCWNTSGARWRFFHSRPLWLTAPSDDGKLT
jgi:hypothetical protein